MDGEILSRESRIADTVSTGKVSIINERYSCSNIDTLTLSRIYLELSGYYLAAVVNIGVIERVFIQHTSVN